MNIFMHTGRFSINLFQSLGQFILFFLKGMLRSLRSKIYWAQFKTHFIEIGFYSLPVVGLTALFTGMVLALQSYTGFARFSAESTIPMVVVLSITRELGPVLASLMVAGRMGASMAAELGSMRVSEQIDALTLLKTDPFQYLITPRVIASLIALPLLVLVADVIGVCGGYIASVYKLGFNPDIYIKKTLDFIEWNDVSSGLIKACAFGGIISMVSCYIGYHTSGGAKGVGRATTLAVVGSSVLILLTNYLMTAVFFTGGPA